MPAPLHVIYFTDPLCSWSWALEPIWRRLRWRYGDQLRCRCRMGGLLADSGRYHDPLNDIHHPAQMAPQWMQIEQLTGAPLNPLLWHENPPTSSYPACTAYKAAESFGLRFAEVYLRRLRESAMLEARDVSQRSELLEAARQANGDLEPSDRVDLDVFAQRLTAAASRAAFREDLKETRFHQIGRFPTLILYRPGERGLALTGFRPYAALQKAVEKVAPDLQPVCQSDDLAAYVQRWRRITLAEVSALFDIAPERVRVKLEAEGLESAIAEAPVAG